MNDLILTKDSSNEQIKEYFNAILKLSQLNNKFPVDFDTAWMLVYADKHKAVEELKDKFIENIDYQAVTQKVECKNGIGSSRVIKYFLSVSCLEYFIARKVRPVFEVYRQVFHKATTHEISRKELALMVIQAEEEKERLLLENNSLSETVNMQTEALQKAAPKVLFADAVSTSQRSCLIAELAKIIKQNGHDIGQNRLFEWMRENGYLCQKGEYYNQPTQKAMELGLFEIKKNTIVKPDGCVMVVSTTKVTGKGQIYFVDKFLTMQKK